MAKKSKWNRIKIALVCTESWQTNYITKMNKNNMPKQLKKYCRSLRKHTMHKVKEKLK